MYDRQAALAASRAEVQQLAGQRLSELAPSRRDFAMFVATQRQDLALVARVAPAAAWTLAQTLDYARACDDAEVAALAVTSGTAGIPIEHMAAVSDVTTAPLLRENLVLHASQLQSGRLHGADAAVLPAGLLEGEALRELVATARSLHMASVIEVLTAAELDIALALPHVIVGLRCATAAGDLDVASVRALAARATARATLLVLTPARTPAECAVLVGLCDAVCVAPDVDLAACRAQIAAMTDGS